MSVWPKTERALAMAASTWQVIRLNCIREAYGTRSRESALSVQEKGTIND